MDNLMLRRRNILKVTQAPPDNRIWLIKNGIEQIQNTGGFYGKTGYVVFSGMSGWAATAPTINQGNGYLNIKIQRSGAAVGCIVPVEFIPYTTVQNKKIYIDCDWEMLGSGAYWIGVVMGSNNEYYYKTTEKRSGTGERQTVSFTIDAPSGNPSDVNALIQTSTRSESNINIYNMWIE